jgi:putative hydrolase of the HAD superfamily
MNARGWQAIVFDLDDTLYPEREYVLGGFRAVAEWIDANLNVPAARAFTELKALFEQGVRGDTFNRWLAARGFSEEDLTQTLVRVYRHHHPTLTPFPGVLELLDVLHARYRLGLVSDGILSVQQSKLAALGLADCFDAIVFSDEWGRAAWKPSTLPFEVVAHRLGVSPAWSVYVADNPLKDFLGARQVGMFTIRARYPDGEYSAQMPPAPEYAPHVTITSLDELASILSEVQPVL